MKIKIINQKANYEDSMKLLKENKLQPLTYQEALANGKEFVKAFKGEYKWFWLAGKGLDKSGYHTIDRYGDVRAGKGEVENTVYIWKGNQPLCLYVRSDDDAAQVGGRFSLGADDVPDVVAPVVVGKAMSRKIKPGNTGQIKCQMCDYLVSEAVWNEHIEKHKKFERLVRELILLVD
jgi:hypothetical protein